MLYLMRKIGESIIINGDVEVKLVEVKGKSAKLGFEFPSSVSVLRKEVHDRIVTENLAASMTSDTENLCDLDDVDALSEIDIRKFRRKGDVRPDGSLVDGEAYGNSVLSRRKDDG